MADHAKCPFGAPDVELALADVDGGASLTAVGPTDRVQALRHMGQKMAAMHGAGSEGHGEHGGEGKHGMHSEHQGDGDHSAHSESGSGGHGMHGDGGHAMHDGQMMDMPSVEIAVEEVDGGVRLVFTATNPADVQALRDHLTKHVAMMKEGRCGGDAEASSSHEEPEAAQPEGEHEH